MLPLLPAALIAQYPTSTKAVPKDYAKGFATITEEDARSLVAKLAGSDFLGRGPGQPGFDKAAEWAAERFREAGLAPAGDGGTYFQHLFLSNATVTEGSFGKADGSQAFVWGQNFAFSATGDVDLTARAAFVRFSGDRELSKRDMARLRGRIVVVSPDSVRSAGLSALRVAQEAGTLGTAALAVPSGETVFASRARFTRVAGDAPEVTAMTITGRTALALRAAAGLDPKTWREGVEESGLTMRLAGKATVTDEVASTNVVAKLEGRDAGLRKEAVTIGSHLDHLGTSERGTFWGADDDASGSAANLMIARAFVRNGERPKRSVVFCLWTMEEKGLRGSQFYTRHPAVPLKDTVAYLNMDMVGRDSDNPAWTDRAQENTDAAYASSAKIGSPELYKLVTEANRAVGLNLRDDREDRTMRSDTGSFARVGIPVLKAFTGEHPDYHKMTDTSEKLNYPKMTRVAQWVYLCGQELANRRGRVPYSSTGRYVRGRVRAASDLELPAGAVVEVTLRSGRKVVDTTRLVNTGHLPQIFTLRYDAAKMKGSYSVSARVLMDGKATMVSPSVPVLGTGWNERGFEVVVGGI